jgi:hypothetical protein
VPVNSIPFDQSKRDQLVINAWTTGVLSDGTRLDLTRDGQAEKGFRVNDTGIYAHSLKRLRDLICNENGEETVIVRNAFDVAGLQGASAGHTHPKELEGLPGPEDGVLPAATDKPSYVISPRGVFNITKTNSGFQVALLAGLPLSMSEQQTIANLITKWNSYNGASSTNRLGIGPGCRLAHK